MFTHETMKSWIHGPHHKYLDIIKPCTPPFSNWWVYAPSYFTPLKVIYMFVTHIYAIDNLIHTLWWSGSKTPKLFCSQCFFNLAWYFSSFSSESSPFEEASHNLRFLSCEENRGTHCDFHILLCCYTDDCVGPRGSLAKVGCYLHALRHHYLKCGKHSKVHP